MGQIVGQSTSANIIIGPLVNIYGSTVADLAIANTAIVLVKEGSVSVARGATTSALSVGPGLQRIVLNSTDTNTLGTLTIFVSASAMMPYAKDIEVWQLATWNLFYGSADHILGSAAASVMVSVRVNAALVNYDVPTSADVSAIAVGVLTNYDAPTSADISAMIMANSAAVSGIVAGALTNYDVATSADVSAILAANGIPSSAAVSVLVAGVLTNFGVPTSAGMSAAFSAILTSYDVATSADVSVLIRTARVNIGRVNDVSVSGTGTTADPWRPA